jgi:magnesium transporter
VVLALFVPLCLSTGGNSGSQAATLITRAMALGEIGPRDWFRVFRHELLMGIVLGLTLGVIGFGRAYFLTTERQRSESPPRDEKFHVELVADKPPLVMETKTEYGVLETIGKWLGMNPTGRTITTVTIPVYAEQHLVATEDVRISLPEDAVLPPPTIDPETGRRIYEFPEKCYIPRKPVSLIGLSMVIAIAVTCICLWGTLIGSILPIVFRRFGADPALASSPFVATFVDVTGIVIYFSIATVIVL